jgi:hypothetical protein
LIQKKNSVFISLSKLDTYVRNMVVNPKNK